MKKMNGTKQRTVFVSFNHESVDFVDSLGKKLPQSVKLLRYENNVGDWDSFQSLWIR